MPESFWYWSGGVAAYLLVSTIILASEWKYGWRGWMAYAFYMLILLVLPWATIINYTDPMMERVLLALMVGWTVLVMKWSELTTRE